MELESIIEDSDNNSKQTVESDGNQILVKVYFTRMRIKDNIMRWEEHYDYYLTDSLDLLNRHMEEVKGTDIEKIEIIKYKILDYGEQNEV